MLSATARNALLGAGIGAAGHTASILDDTYGILSAPRKAVWGALGLPEYGHEITGDPYSGALLELLGDPLVLAPSAIGAVAGLGKDISHVGKLGRFHKTLSEEARTLRNARGALSDALAAEDAERMLLYGTARPSFKITDPGPDLTKIDLYPTSYSPPTNQTTRGMSFVPGESASLGDISNLAEGASYPGLRDVINAAVDPRNKFLQYDPDLIETFPNLFGKKGLTKQGLSSLEGKVAHPVPGFEEMTGGRSLAEVVDMMGVGGRNQAGQVLVHGPGKLADIPGMGKVGRRVAPTATEPTALNPLVYRYDYPLPYPQVENAAPGMFTDELAQIHSGLSDIGDMPLDMGLQRVSGILDPLEQRLGNLENTLDRLGPLRRMILRRLTSQ